MAHADDEAKFLDTLKKAQRWSGLNKADFMQLLFGSGSESSWDRLVAGKTPTKTNRAERRLQIARLVLDKTDVPPEAFGLSAPEPSGVDQLGRDLREEMDEMKTELLEVIERATGAEASDLLSQEPGPEEAEPPNS